jgi:hypothetical protein
MSRLDDLFNTLQPTSETFKKQQIKDLFLELIGEDAVLPRPNDEESIARFYRVSGQNFTKDEIRRKIEEL